MQPAWRVDAIPEGTLLADAYRVGRRLGQGGMGTVYEATLERLGRRVAVKVLKPSLARDELHLERFRREAVAAAALGHPNIIQVIDFHRTPAGAFMVMELLDGEPLNRLVRREGQLGAGRTAAIMTQVLAGLGAAHEAGVVHRDLKPPNVFVTPIAGGLEVVKLLDFGVAKLRDATGRLTIEGSVVGTPHFFSPEQARGEAVDGRADLFAAGILLHLLLTGRHPFHANNVATMVRRIVDGDPDPIQTDAPDVPAGLAAVVGKALSKRRRDRYQTAAEMAAALKPFLPDVLSEPVVPGPRALGASPSEASRRRRRRGTSRWMLVFAALLGAGLTLALASAALGIYLVWRAPEPPPQSPDPVHEAPMQPAVPLAPVE